MESMEPRINLAAVVPRTEAEGPGVRFAIWVQGCSLRCAGCCNPHLWHSRPVEEIAPTELVARVKRTEGIEGVTLLGGEPFEQALPLAHFAEEVRAVDLSVMVFTGYTMAELEGMEDDGVSRLLAATDLLVDGRYEADKRELNRRWIGSSNQRIHFLTERYEHFSEDWDAAPNTLEIRYRGGGDILINGFPFDGIEELLRFSGTGSQEG